MVKLQRSDENQLLFPCLKKNQTALMLYHRNNVLLYANNAFPLPLPVWKVCLLLGQLVPLEVTFFQ